MDRNIKLTLWFSIAIISLVAMVAIVIISTYKSAYYYTDKSHLLMVKRETGRSFRPYAEVPNEYAGKSIARMDDYDTKIYSCPKYDDIAIITKKANGGKYDCMVWVDINTEFIPKELQRFADMGQITLTTTIDELPWDYTTTQAIADGCYVNIHSKISNAEKLDEFFLANQNPDISSGFIRMVSVTNEGDPIINECWFDRAKGKFTLITDSTRDKFGDGGIYQQEFDHLNKTDTGYELVRNPLNIAI